MWYLPNIIFYCRTNHLLLTSLIKLCQNDVYILTNLIIQCSLYLENKKELPIYQKIINQIYESIDHSINKKIIKSINLLKNIPTIIKQKSYDPKYNSLLPLSKDKFCINANFSSLTIKNSYHKPTILEFKCIHDDQTFYYPILFKKEDVRKDVIILNIIKLMSNILEKKFYYSVSIKNYNVLAITKNTGIIEIVQKSKTISEIQNLNFSVQNYIMEKNPNLPIDTIRKRFTISCAIYCVISYLLGIGDRHLDNIMITDDGYLFHIDFSFILGQSPKLISPEIKITPDMVDAMGGEKSQYFKLFQKTCTESFNELRRHSNIFMIMLSMLHYSEPKIDHGQYSLEYIKKQVLSRFIPGENNEQAKLIFITK